VENDTVERRIAAMEVNVQVSSDWELQLPLERAAVRQAA